MHFILSKKRLALAFASLILASCDYVGDMDDVYASDYQCEDGLELLPYNPQTFPYSNRYFVYKKTSEQQPLGRVTDNQQVIDIVIRDFDVTHPDFENFQEEAYASLNNGTLATWDPGYQGNSEWMARRSDPANYGCGNTQTPELGIAVGTAGYPKDLMSKSGAVSTVPDYIAGISGNVTQGYAWYGEFGECSYDPSINPLGLKTLRGFASELCNNSANAWSFDASESAKTCNNICKKHLWSNAVYATPGMVKQHLKFNGDDMMSPQIQRNRTACDNVYFDQWFTDVAGINKRTNSKLVLNQDLNSPAYFTVNYDWNNGGYFPLDEIDASYNWMGPKQNTDQFGAQTLSIFCPPYNYEWAASQADFMGNKTATLCNAWKAAGGPKIGTAAQQAALANPSLGLLHLRNYGFTIMGYTSFKYNKGAGEIFEITGDDDIWVYVDGVLVTDLGGVHLPAKGTVDMDYLAMNGHGCHSGDPLAKSCDLDADGLWKNASVHHLHFFYADRQSDGSNLRIRSSLSSIPSATNSIPSITEAKIEEKNGVQKVRILMNQPLDQETMAAIRNYGEITPIFVVIRKTSDPITAILTSETYGFYVSSISDAMDKGESGYLYEITGTIKTFDGRVTQLLGENYIAINAPYDADDAYDESMRKNYEQYYGGEIWSYLLEWNTRITFQVTSTSGIPVRSIPNSPNDWAPFSWSPISIHSSNLFNYYSEFEPGELFLGKKSECDSLVREKYKGCVETDRDVNPGDYICQIPM